MNKPIIIGIAGGSASGKSTIAEKIVEKFREEKKVVIIRQDDYYKDQSHMPFVERVKTNYDHPFAFDNDYMVYQVKEFWVRQFRDYNLVVGVFGDAVRHICAVQGFFCELLRIR